MANRQLDVFELRASEHRNNDLRYSIHQRPPGANGEDAEPVELVSIWGAPVHLAREHISSILRAAGLSGGLGAVRPGDVVDLDEEQGTRLAVLFFALKPMRKLERIRKIATAIMNMSPEATYYWLSKAANGYDYHTRRRHMRALRILLAEE